MSERDSRDKRIAELESRIAELESMIATVADPPEQESLSRRDLLRAGAAVGGGALLGAAGLKSVTKPARADAQGGLGTASDPWQNAYFQQLQIVQGNSIADETGTPRITIGNLDTTIENDDGQTIFSAGQSVSGFGPRLLARENMPARIRDSWGGFTAIEYQPSATIQDGTLAFLGASADLKSNNITNVANGDSSDGGLAFASGARLWVDGNGEIFAEDSSGNSTQIS